MPSLRQVFVHLSSICATAGGNARALELAAKATSGLQRLGRRLGSRQYPDIAALDTASRDRQDPPRGRPLSMVNDTEPDAGKSNLT